jgi:hypothetical protein
MQAKSAAGTAGAPAGSADEAPAGSADEAPLSAQEQRQLDLQLRQLMDMARRSMDEGNGEGALQYALIAANIGARGDSSAIMSMLDEAKTSAAEAREKVRSEYGLDSDNECAAIAAACSVRDETLARESILKVPPEAHARCQPPRPPNPPSPPRGLLRG